MKKIISLLVLGIMLVGITAPGIAGAQEKLKECCVLGSDVELSGQACGAGSAVGSSAEAMTEGCAGATQCAPTSNWGMYCLINTINNVTNWLFYILLIAVVLMGVIGGVIYMSSTGDAEKAEKGKKVIIYAIVGLVLALIARLIPSVVRLIIGM